MNCFQTPGKWRSMACKDGIRGRGKTAHRLHPSIPVLIAGGPNPPPGSFGGNSKGSASRHLATNKNFFGGFSFLALEQTELLHVHIEKGSAPRRAAAAVVYSRSGPSCRETCQKCSRLGILPCSKVPVSRFNTPSTLHGRMFGGHVTHIKTGMSLRNGTLNRLHIPSSCLNLASRNPCSESRQ